MSEYENLKKPEHIKDEIWSQHLQWWDVMSRQVAVNFTQHVKEVEQKGGRIK